MGVRPPVVVVLGHVDHGKTTLLDTIRKSNIVSRESGGITQHVGAYVIEHQGKPLTVLDTPGHAAFSEMRSRGAKVADVAILVVAADDGVKPQTKEAIGAIRSANIPFVVALNKIDKSNADVDRAKTQLTEAGVLLEGWGGDTPNVEISAKAGTGIDALLDMLALVADMAELQANAAGPAQGVVIEAHQDQRRGPAATLLVQNGMLHVGDAIIAGSVSGKVKALESFTGKAVSQAGPSTPVVVLGLSQVPDVGDEFRVAGSDTEARERSSLEAQRRAFEQRIAEGNPAMSVKVLVKADVVGSLEALVSELKKLKNSHIALEVVGGDTGDIIENDVKRAEPLGAVIVGFRVKARPAILGLAERLGVVMQTFDVIYECVDAIKKLCVERLPKQTTREEMGTVKILATFKRDLPRHVIGGLVTKGVARKEAQFEIMRNEAIVGSGQILEMQMNQVPVDEVSQNRECGMLVKYRRGGPAQEGDTVNIFLEREKTPKLFSD